MIKQRYQEDCGVACLAMFTGKSYDYIADQIQAILNRTAPINGLNNEEMAKILLINGFEPMQIYTILPDVPAIIAVPSLGTKKRFHYIYFNGNEIDDPSNFETYSIQDFMNGFPLSDAIICQKTLNVELPTHLFNYFDWEYINDNDKI